MKNKSLKHVIACIVALPLLATVSSCGNTESQSAHAEIKDLGTSQLIKVNQIAYLPSAQKQAIVPVSSSSLFTSFNVHDAQSNDIVYSGKLGTSSLWGPSNETVSIADFSSVNTPGNYYITVAERAKSPTFVISAQGYKAVHDAALKAYYFNRAGMQLDKQFAGAWERPEGHPDTKVLVHESAASTDRPAGSVLSSPKGWYDAGDYNKYIVNSGISTYTLLLAYSHFEDFYLTGNTNIPESNNEIADIVDEIMWNVDWMYTMQDPNDGGVYHKLTTKNFSGTIMPHQGNEPRYVVQKSTGAALNFAATFAKASNVLAKIPQLANKADTYKKAAIAAYKWAMANPKAYYQQPDDIKTGEYGDNDLAGEFAWASAELFLLTGDNNYLSDFERYAQAPTVPGWQDTMSLAYISLLSNNESSIPNEMYNKISSKLIAYADSIVEMHKQSAYGVAMSDEDFVWGSNSVALNKAFVLMQTYRKTNNLVYKQVAASLVDYVMGKNPTDYSYITGFGSKTPMDPHHRASYADDVINPVPGFVIGGPHTGEQDGCDYAGSFPATTYADHWCSYSTNEVTINWNAPLVYVLAALHTAQ